ncbi:MAG: hypothetical protein MJZ25_12965 [Fibrobacter sp.]|nr:hypothetical protein [Fibrobacter sp.]
MIVNVSYDDKYLKYQTNRLGSTSNMPAKLIKYSRNTDVACACGIVTYNPLDNPITIESYDMYFPQTAKLPSIDSIRSAYCNIDQETGELSFADSMQFLNLISVSDPESELDDVLTVDGTDFYRYHFVPESTPDISIPVGWSAQLFYACNMKSMGGDLDEWDDASNRIYPLCTSVPGVAYKNDSTLYSGIVARGSTIMHIRQHYDTDVYKRNYVEFPMNDPVNKWAIPTADNTELGTKYNIFPYIFMNGLQL